MDRLPTRKGPTTSGWHTLGRSLIHDPAPWVPSNEKNHNSPCSRINLSQRKFNVESWSLISFPSIVSRRHFHPQHEIHKGLSRRSDQLYEKPPHHVQRCLPSAQAPPGGQNERGLWVHHYCCGPSDSSWWELRGAFSGHRSVLCIILASYNV